MGDGRVVGGRALVLQGIAVKGGVFQMASEFSRSPRSFLPESHQHQRQPMALFSTHLPRSLQLFMLSTDGGRFSLHRRHAAGENHRIENSCSSLDHSLAADFASPRHFSAGSCLSLSFCPLAHFFFLGFQEIKKNRA